MRGRWRVEVLSEDDIERVHRTTLQVLERVGLQIDSEPVLEALAAAGARVDRDRVRFPAPMVEEAVALAPRSFLLAARDPACDLPIDGSVGYLSVDGTPAHIVDLESGARRPSTAADHRDAMRLADALPEIAYTWPAFAISDVHPLLQSVEHAYQELVFCSKHAQPNEVITPQDARATIEMARILAGGDAGLRARPLISSYQCAISPLAYDGAALEAAIEFARAGVPAGWVSMAVATAAAPTTLAGHVVSVNAELLGGIAILQTIVPGAPTFYGPYGAFMDLSTGDVEPAWGGEDVLFKLAAAQMAERYGLVNNIGAYQTGAKVSDWQAGAQSALSLMGVAIAASADLIAAVGALRNASVFSFPELVLEAELFGMVCHMFDQGFPVDEDHLAFEVIEAVGPGGNFLAHPHTRAHMRERWRSELFGRESWEAWEAAGRPEAKDLAKERAREILATHEVEPVPEDVDRELRKVVERRERELREEG